MQALQEEEVLHLFQEEAVLAVMVQQVAVLELFQEESVLAELFQHTPTSHTLHLPSPP